MKTISKLQSRACTIASGNEGFSTFEKTILILGGILSAAIVVTFVFIRFIGEGNGEGTGFADSIVRQIRKI